MNPESRSGKPPSRGKKYPAFTCNLNNPEISEGIISSRSSSVVGFVMNPEGYTSVL